MGLFSCFGCGTADQERADPPAVHDEKPDPSNLEKPAIQTETTANPTETRPAEPEAESTHSKEDLLGVSRAPEETFGSHLMITDEQINRQAYDQVSQPSNFSADPSATEEDRWFGA